MDFILSLSVNILEIFVGFQKIQVNKIKVFQVR